MLEIELLECGKIDFRLRHDDLQLAAFEQPQRRSAFRAHANPVESRRRVDGAVRFRRDFEVQRVKRSDQRRVDLQQRLAAGEDGKALAAFSGWPLSGDGVRKAGCVRILVAERAVRPYEIRVAEVACGVCSIRFASRPEIAAGEAAKDGGPSCVRAFALEGVEDLFYCVGHVRDFLRKNGADTLRPTIGSRVDQLIVNDHSYPLPRLFGCKRDIQSCSPLDHFIHIDALSRRESTVIRRRAFFASFHYYRPRANGQTDSFRI